MGSQCKKTICLLLILGVILFSVGFLFVMLMPMMIFLLPGIVVGYILMRYTPVFLFALIMFINTQVGAPFKTLWRWLHDKLWYRMTGPKKFLWFFFYELVCYLFPNHKWRCMNYGYATKSSDGKLISNLKETDEPERFQL